WRAGTSGVAVTARIHTQRWLLASKASSTIDRAQDSTGNGGSVHVLFLVVVAGVQQREAVAYAEPKSLQYEEHSQAKTETTSNSYRDVSLFSPCNLISYRCPRF
ncbi:unnamed protein product, partial [Ectocarpus sp. 13 AM-2016]